MLKLEETKIAIIGLGYMGLQLSVKFAKNLQVLGFDINTFRVEELKSGTDGALEVSIEKLSGAVNLSSS